MHRHASHGHALAFSSLTRIVPWWGWLIVAAAIVLVYWEMRKF